MPITAPAPATPREQPLTCEVARIDILHVSKIDQIEHAFSARLFFQLILRGGQRDDDLLRGLNEPSPEFQQRPSATWLLHQFHFPNALKLEYAERKVTKMGADDLHLILRVDGTFLQHFKLHDFPYDSQILQVHLSSHCANEGIAPVRFTWSPLTVKLQRPTHFALKDVWEMSKPVRLDLETLNPSPGRTYPVLKTCVEVTRRPNYHLVNVVFPMACFVLMGCCQFAHETSNVEGRLEYMGAIVLTSTAYKMSVASSIPAIAYVTLLDRYVLACIMICILLVFEAAFVRDPFADSVALFVSIALFVALQVAFCYTAYIAVPRRAEERRRTERTPRPKPAWREKMRRVLMGARRNSSNNARRNSESNNPRRSPAPPAADRTTEAPRRLGRLVDVESGDRSGQSASPGDDGFDDEARERGATAAARDDRCRGSSSCRPPSASAGSAPAARTKPTEPRISSSQRRSSMGVACL